MHRKKSAQSHAKDLNGAESDEGDDEDEGNAAERVEAEEVANESEQMDVENMENGPTTTEDIQEAVHSHNGQISSTEADCTDSSVDGIQKSSPGVLDRESGNNGEVQAVEHK